ncbi:uncharacterized protein A4U43_C01F9520 [Asparagus officinalis]|uniref:Anaphase-promoting complex subunit 4 WD40 domain-containing protein n=1 Tax=Asparagus officinalis TaxID=4686 RepID=A0A5P1FNX5_ASPOF|nr:WD repeat-containing protein 44-like [Asparagus officinalis]XP_020241865.1 WD repeat-containing protein 44-like [Asparagus officinalis]ONK79734.1 uncharacterized protein A4U43_C01F9520 [Asparagus officinalis]
MGLIGDPALARRKSSIRSRSEGNWSADFEDARSVPQSRSSFSVDLNNVHILEPGAVSKSYEESDGNSHGNFNGDVDLSCTIKNLDSGEEFVVKEDGMWNKPREIGLGRQLTVEEFEMCVGRSPIVQELMRRQNVEDSSSNGGSSNENGGLRAGPGANVGLRWKKKGGWLRSIKNIAGNVVAGGHYRDRRVRDEKDTSLEKRGMRLSLATDDSQDGGSHSLHQRIRVRQYGKSFKEFAGLHMTQEIQAHTGSIWTIKFSLDGKYLASAGEDCVIHVWQVSEVKKKGDLVIEIGRGETGSCSPFFNVSRNESPESALALTCIKGSHWEKKRRARLSHSRKSVSSDQLVVPDQLFALGEKPICSFNGHLADVLDLSWSKSEYLLSSSMDKTVRLWHMSSNSCLKTFSHSDYVTCIQFNPVDDRYFISGSLDEKVRIWSIPDRQIVDWNDLHEMVTAACYTPDGQGALVGSHKGSCHLYDTSDNKLHQKSQIDLQNKKKKSSHKKITGFQFAPGSLSEVLITSADSRIRVVDGAELVHKFKGFRNTSSQISASLTTNGKHIVCASEDSHVYIWRHDSDAQPNRSRAVSVTQSYEHFHCRDVTVAIPWPTKTQTTQSNSHDSSPLSSSSFNTSINPFGDRITATWPEEKFLTPPDPSSLSSSIDLSNGVMQLKRRSAWGMVIVTAGRGGRIRTFQNFGFPF